MKGDKREGADGNGNNNLCEEGCRQDTERQKEVFESTILIIPRLDSWIMKFLVCMVSQTSRGEERQNMYVRNFQNLLPISIGQLSEELYSFVEIQELENMKPATKSAISAEELKEMAFRKYKSYVPLYVPIVDHSYS